MNRPFRTGVALLSAVTLGLTLAACGKDSDHAMANMSDTKTASNGDVFNQADVEFATNMIPHHAQAIQMVTLTDRRKLDPEVKQLAEQIRGAQGPEVETMAGWLTDWGKEIPETSMDHANAGHDVSEMPEMEGMQDMPGMMSTEEMQALADASDAEFEEMFLDMMKRHHEGAIEMAQDEQENGAFADAVALAKTVVSAQQTEVEQIDGLLAS